MGSRTGRARRGVRAALLGVMALSIVVTGTTAAGAAKEKPEIDVLLSGLLSSQVTSLPHQLDGAKAAAAAILKKHGVKINIAPCNDGLDPNLAAACARRAVTDHADAVISGLTANSAALYPTLEAAKIPYFGNTPIVDADYQSPIAFPFTPGLPGNALGLVGAAKKDGCKNLGVLAADAAASLSTAETLTTAAQKGGMTASTTSIPQTAPDYAPYVAQMLTDKPDCVVLTVSSPERAITAIRQSTKPTLPIYAAAQILTPQVRDTLGAAKLEGSTAINDSFVSNEPSLNPEFHADMAAYSSDASLVDDTALRGWTSVYAVYEASQNVKGALTSAKLLAAANKTKFDLKAFPKPIDFAMKSPVKTLPRLRNTNLILYQFKNGQLVSRGSVDVGPLMAQVVGQ